MGCLVDPELQRDKEIHTGRYFRLQVLRCDPHHVLHAGVQEEGQGGRQTPDTSFYQVRVGSSESLITYYVNCSGSPSSC